MEWKIKLKEAVSYWEKRLVKIEGRKDPECVRHVRRNLQLLTDAEIYGVKTTEFGGI